MEIPFIKMHGAGNDFVVLDGRAGPLGLTPERIRLLADRRLGIGCDQLISLEPATGGADVFMRIHNPDGSEAGACGNATRCVATLVGREQGRPTVTIRTISGDLPSTLLPDGRVTVDLGPPRRASARWRGAHNRMAGVRRPRADDRPSRDELHRHNRPRYRPLPHRVGRVTPRS
jgi:diaminopimelate epimerase